MLPVDVLLRIPQQDVHVRIDALQRALVLGLAPFEADDELGADSVPGTVSKACISRCKTWRICRMRAWGSMAEGMG